MSACRGIRDHSQIPTFSDKNLKMVTFLVTNYEHVYGPKGYGVPYKQEQLPAMQGVVC